MSVRLDTVCDIIMGQAPAGDEYNDKGEGLPLLAGAGDFKNGRPLAKKFTRVITKECVAGDIVIGIRASIGDKVVADRPYCLGRGVAVIRPKSKDVVPRYLWHWMTAVRAELERKAKGATFKQVNRTDIGEMKLTLPSSEEQARIAGMLDQAEKLQSQRRAAIALLDQLPQAIFLEMFGDPATNPKMWPLTTVGEVADVQGGLQVSSARKNLPIEIPYLRVANVYREFLNLSEIKCIRATASEIARTTLATADLLIVEGHGNAAEIGRGALWDGSITPCIHQNHLIRVRFDQKAIIPRFASSYINSIAGRQHLLRAGNTTSGLNTISVSDVKRTPMLRPPLELQNGFAARLEAIYRAKAAHQCALDHLDALIGSLQAGAFGNAQTKQLYTRSSKAENERSESRAGSSAIDRLIESYRDVNVEALGAARKAIDFPELAGIKFAREGMEWSTALSGMLAKQTEMSALMASVISPPRLPAYGELFARFGAVNGIAKLMEDSLFPSRKLTSLIDSIAAGQLTGMGGALESIRRLTVANSLDTSVAHMMAGFAKHQTAIDVITQGWRNSMWDDIQKSSLMFERLQASSIPSEILEIGSLERFNAVRLLHSTTQDRIWEDDPEADTAIEIVRTEYLDSVEAGLQAIDPRLLKMFQGAKLAGKSQNVDRARHVAVSLREMTTHLLHILAPTAAIKSWSTSESDFANGKPTRASRIRFIYSRYGTEVLDFFEGDIREAIKWIDRINGETHALDGFESDGAIEALIARFEGIALSLIRGARGFE